MANYIIFCLNFLPPHMLLPWVIIDYKCFYNTKIKDNMKARYCLLLTNFCNTIIIVQGGSTMIILEKDAAQQQSSEEEARWLFLEDTAQWWSEDNEENSAWWSSKDKEEDATQWGGWCFTLVGIVVCCLSKMDDNNVNNMWHLVTCCQNDGCDVTSTSFFVASQHATKTDDRLHHLVVS